MFAGGGLAALNPMASRASVVPANTWRVVGDNMRHPESYIPWDGSAKSKATLAETNRAFGVDTEMLAVAQEALAASRRGETIHEDGSFVSMSTLADAYNEKLAAAMYGQTGAHASTSPEYQAAWASWLPARSCGARCCSAHAAWRAVIPACVRRSWTPTSSFSIAVSRRSAFVTAQSAPAAISCLLPPSRPRSWVKTCTFASTAIRCPSERC
jgi:hypothetical protein